MLKYDSVHGRFKHPVSTRKGKLLVEESDNTEIVFTARRTLPTSRGTKRVLTM